MKFVDKIDVYFHYIISFFYMNNVWAKWHKTDKRLRAISTTFLLVCFFKRKREHLWN